VVSQRIGYIRVSTLDESAESSSTYAVDKLFTKPKDAKKARKKNPPRRVNINCYALLGKFFKRRRRHPRKPIPDISIAQVSGSGTTRICVMFTAPAATNVKPVTNACVLVGSNPAPTSIPCRLNALT
jgi:hypothetical protein